ncbi:hypothetical protein LFT45_04285 [Arthrobacter sp. FW305-BF8]|uniref:hypothetical protein n=1 Tax=Arthrobacter sp. FW305-BF8 TaxID=2879617 RepID=UPI001F3B201C|nr:hypothetical protein [Arthrobacter sp. FW305-BF8]UKA55161.1 hypothetical protein LFT45_04285 [Arthrobacter sp. FW305-BF8]
MVSRDSFLSGVRAWWSKPHQANTVTAISTVLVAGLTFASGYVGAQVGADTALQVSRNETEAENLRRSQEKRQTVYQGYLDAANEFSGATHGLSRVYNDSVKKLADGTIKANQNMPHLVDAQNRFNTARSAYQDAINDVYIFGSDEAWKAHKELAALLPDSLHSTEVSFPPPAVPDSEAFIGAYRGFNEVVCVEVAPVPRSGCDRH